jgi:nitrite reductase/ring-hydroxylating ferredoxin subunit/uncharacterized membrane protein
MASVSTMHLGSVDDRVDVCYVTRADSKGESMSIEAGSNGSAPTPSVFARASRLTETATSAVEGLAALDRLGDLVAALGGAVRAGALKDALSGTWMGHPAHPVLTDLPIGAWTSSFLLDVFGGERAQPGSDTLVGLGILAALPTAVTGLSDLADVENKENRRIGIAHAAANVAGLGLYSLSYLFRRSGGRKTGVALSTLGVGAMLAGAFLGGHLSFRKGIGVDHTAFEAAPKRWTAVMASDELSEGTPKMATVGRSEVMLYRAQGRLFALANRCSHRGGPLTKGKVQDGTVTCPWHLSTFDLEDGSIVRGPATAPQPAFEARENEGKIEVRAANS